MNLQQQLWSCAGLAMMTNSTHWLLSTHYYAVCQPGSELWLMLSRCCQHSTACCNPAGPFVFLPVCLFLRPSPTQTHHSISLLLCLFVPGSSSPTITPLPQLPHQRGGAAVWRLKSAGMFGVGGQALSVEAARPLRKGEALSMDYGPDKLDSTLLLDYGVIDSSSAKVRLGCSLGRCVLLCTSNFRHAGAVVQAKVQGGRVW